MYIRCASCKTCTRVVFGTMHRGVTCITCGRSYSLADADQLGSTPDERYRQAAEYAISHRIDLASAYSVLLGIMSLEEAPSTRGDLPGPVLDKAASPEEEQRPASEHLDYDPGFRDAVAEGYLTLRQAVERGDRMLYASKIAQKHGLPMSLAFLVAENRMALVEALKRMTSIAEEGPAPERDRPVLGARVIGAIALTLVAVLAWHWWVGVEEGTRSASGGGGHAAPPSVEVSIEIRTDPSDRLIEVRGVDPDTVLHAFCERVDRTVRRVPVRAAPMKGDYIGYFRENDALRAILIRRDPGTGSWVCGNARDPVVAIEVPDFRAESAEARLTRPGE